MKCDEAVFPLLSPSIIAADWLRMESDIEECIKHKLMWLHCDVMDGHFVPNLTIGPDFVAAIKRRFPQTVCDCHLMVSHPVFWTSKFIRAGADVITVHAENTAPDEISELCGQCRQAGLKFGLSIRPTTPIEVIAPWLSHVDVVLLLSVYPGFYGQTFIPGSQERVRQVRALAGAGRPLIIEADGGLNTDNVGPVLEAGADVIVTGGHYFSAPDRAAVVGKFNAAFAACRSACRA